MSRNVVAAGTQISVRQPPCRLPGSSPLRGEHSEAQDLTCATNPSAERPCLAPLDPARLPRKPGARRCTGYLDPQQAYLFVIDGGKALRKAIHDVFGKRSLVQRCQEHKRRNVLGYLPKRMQTSANKAMRDAFRSTSKATAKKRLQQYASALE